MNQMPDLSHPIDTGHDCARAMPLRRRCYSVQAYTLRLPVSVHCVRNEPAGLTFVVGMGGRQPPSKVQHLAEMRSGSEVEACFVRVGEAELAVTHTDSQGGRCRVVTVALASNEGKVLDGFQIVM